jgi:drug/metabolite transporter (DMT)-like permease
MTVTYVAAVLTMILLSLGQVLLKRLAVKIAAAGVTFTNWHQEALNFLWLAVSVCLTYMAVLACWLYVLRSLDLNRAFSFAALTFVFVPLFSNLILGERITIGTVGGAGLIVIGIIVSANY